MSKKAMIVINPNAGKKTAQNSIWTVIDILNQNNYVPTVYPTRKRGDATRFIEKHAAKYDLLICSGGDGTFQEMSSGLMSLPSHKRPPVGYVPAGTTNDIANSLGLAKTAPKAMRDIISGKCVPYDLGKFNDRFFSYIAAFGAFTEASYSANQGIKSVIGHLAYVLEGMKSISRIRPYHITIEYDDQILEGNFLYGAVSNSTSVAGLFKLKPGYVALSDGKFEIMLIKEMQNANDLAVIINSLLSGNYDPQSVIFLHASKVRIHCDEAVAWCLDGEFGGETKDADIANLHEAIQIIVK